MNDSTSPIVLAFSGGLDTSFCIPWLTDTYSRPVVTATVNTGGIDAEAAQALEEKSRALGAIEHVMIDARREFFDSVLRFLIMGNVRRGNLYPLCVGAERGVQAKYLAKLARERGERTVAHGCTAAGNDQVRFEVILKTLAPELEVLAPVRDHNWVREEQLRFLNERNMPVPGPGSAYSINRGLWGVTIGGTETLDSHGSIPESA
ncbi:MAG: argininosuccinate synthase, partial [Gammaproteobacteria bacterium]